jgi:hypothetical protein
LTLAAIADSHQRLINFLPSTILSLALRQLVIMVATRSMYTNPSKILHYGGGVKMPDQKLTTPERHTTQMAPVTTMTDRTLPLFILTG